MMKWIPCELHTHTIHSDGRLSLLQLAEGAKKQGIECLCITDHNTIAAHSEVDSVAQKSGVEIIKGMEWTTFYGHVLCMGISKYVDWRDLNEDNIHLGIERIHDQGALIGVAHPFQDGSPIITGGKWQYKVSNWSDFDYMEVWHENFPAYQRENIRSYNLWNDLLNKGHEITAVNGIDWHNIDVNEKDIPVTYLGIEEYINEDITNAALLAIKKGLATVTMGPLLIMTLNFDNDKEQFQIGDKIELSGKSQHMKINISVDYNTRKGHWNLTCNEVEIRLMSNLGELKNIRLSTDINKATIELSALGLSWIRAELHGSIKDINKVIAFTNPVYFK